MIIVGISAFYHDSAVALIKDGEVIFAAQEERYTRKKNDSAFPTLALNEALRFAKLELNQVDQVVFYEKPFLKFERLLETYLAFAPKGIFSFWKSMPIWIKEKIFLKRIINKHLLQIDEKWKGMESRLLFSQHHLSHAASAFYPSPFKDAMILTVDGVGEWTTTSISKGIGSEILPLKEILFPHSLGLLYSAFTYYLGFKVNCDEYKVMGLAPYGTPRFKDLIFEKLIDLRADGSFRLNMEYFSYASGLKMVGSKFEKLFGHPVRSKTEELTLFHMDVAASIQKVTEEVMLLIVQQMHNEFGGDNLCLAGGVALNCVANGRILRDSPYKNIWIQPAAGDAGGALGAALAAYYEYTQKERVVLPQDSMSGALLGSCFSNEEVRVELDKLNLSYEYLDDHVLFDAIAADIDRGSVVGFFRGRMEFGPRALGARSIIGDARNRTMQSTMNLKIKYRESFRPFAPIVMEEHCSDYFEMDVKSPYMMLVAQVAQNQLISQNTVEAFGIEKLNQIRSTIPAVTHVDNSARIQTVSSTSNRALYGVLDAFYQLTGCPVLINTSFNVMNEPIVATPADAIRCFLSCEMDILVIENYIIRKR